MMSTSVLGVSMLSSKLGYVHVCEVGLAVVDLLQCQVRKKKFYVHYDVHICIGGSQC